MLYALMFAAVGLTFALAHSKNMIFGFPAAIFWALICAYGYANSAVKDATDAYYLLFWAGGGMTIFCVLGAYALREKPNPKGEGDVEDTFEEPESESKSAKEQEASGETDGFENESDYETAPSQRTTELRGRANERRTAVRKRRMPWGEFK